MPSITLTPFFSGISLDVTPQIDDGNKIMLHVHQNGVGVAGVYTFEVAEMKVRQVEALAREREFPLMLSIEPEE